MANKDTDYKPDYGMLAYLKAEDLSRRMDSLAKKAYIGTPPALTPVKYYKNIGKTIALYDVTALKSLKSNSGPQGLHRADKD